MDGSVVRLMAAVASPGLAVAIVLHRRRRAWRNRMQVAERQAGQKTKRATMGFAAGGK